MFTGIIETLAKVESIKKQGANITLTLSSSITPKLKIDQSLSHNGVCLTVIKIVKNNYSVTAIRETLLKSNLSQLKKGDFVNIERSMPATGRFDGHIVQGHVDTTAVCKSIKNHKGSYQFMFAYDKNQKNITVEKGSITVNGVSLTVVSSHKNRFSVHIIPYTFNNTNIKALKTGSLVNIEFDIIGKYISQLLNR